MSAESEAGKARTGYYSWSNDERRSDTPAVFAAEMARRAGLPVVAVVPTANSVPRSLAKAFPLTDRGRRTPPKAAVWLYWYPITYKQFAHRPADSQTVIIVEHVDFAIVKTWAAKRGAIDLRSNLPMPLEIPPETIAVYEAIEWAGNNGWADKWGARDALRCLESLYTDGRLNKDELLGYMLDVKRREALERLAKLVDQVTDKAIPIRAAGPRVRNLNW